MFRTLRDLFRREEAPLEAIEIRLEDIPAWLDAREAALDEELTGKVAPNRQRIEAALSSIRTAIDPLRTAGETAVPHQRLKAISRSALPEFVKSIDQMLEKQPSGDTEAFYTAAAGVLKGCLRALKGQGKYIAAAYPEEMRDFRAAVKDLGTEINLMTQAIADFRARHAGVDETREIYEQLIRVRSEYASVREESIIRAEKAGSDAARIRQLEDALRELEGSPHHAAARELDLRIRTVGERKEEVAREYASIRTHALHVFRKAEKVLEKHLDHDTAEELRRAEDALSVAPPEHPDAIIGLLTRVMPTVMDLIGRGEVALKNREEQHLFSDAGILRTEIVRVIAEHRDLDTDIGTAEAEQRALTGYAEEQVVAQDLGHLRHQAAEREAGTAARREHLAVLHVSTGRLLEDLESKIATIAGRNVTVRAGELPPIPE